MNFLLDFQEVLEIPSGIINLLILGVKESMRSLKCLSILMCLVLLFSACTKTKDYAMKEKEGSKILTGRYLEEKIDFPEFTNVITMDQVADNTYMTLGTKNGYDPPYEVWCSEDNGNTWKEKKYDSLSDMLIISATFTANGGLYATFISDDSNPNSLQYQTAFIDEKGITVLQGVEELSQYNQGLAVTKSEDLLINQGTNLLQCDLDGVEAPISYVAGSPLWAGSYRVFEDRLIMSCKEEIQIFDTNTGSKIGGVICKTNSNSPRVVATQSDDSGIFYCDDTGLYRITMDGVITEQVIDGTLSTFGMPSVNLLGLFPDSDNNFLLLCKANDKIELKSFSYDPNALLEPSKNLILFSLNDDKFIRQAIGLYQREHPDIKITYQVAVSGTDAITASDAKRQLSTELLSGNGPDILILDNLPIESFIRQGVLADLKESIQGLDNELFRNISEQYLSSEGCFAFPARMSTQIIAGVNIEGVHTIGDLVNYIDSQSDKRTGITPKLIMELFYPICVPSWFNANGEINESTMRTDLTTLKHLAEISSQNKNVPYLNAQSTRWSGKGLSLIYGQLDNLEDMSYVYSAIDKRQEGVVKLFPDVSGGVLIPSSILGVNAASKEATIAKDFVQFALSFEAQNNSFETGMPTNLNALEAIGKSHEPGFYFGGGGETDKTTGENYELGALWFTELQLSQIISLLESAEMGTPISVDVQQIIVDEATKCFNGTQSIDDTLSILNQVVTRHLQENS